MYLQAFSLALLAALLAPKANAPHVDIQLSPKDQAKLQKIKPLSKQQLLTLGRDKGLTKSKNKGDVARTFVDSADAVRNQVKLTTLCARETFVNADGTGTTVFNSAVMRTCIENGYSAGVRIVFPVEKHKGYIVNCGTTNLRWTIKRLSLPDPIQLSNPANPTHTFVSAKTGTEIVEFLIPLNHQSYAIEPWIHRCQVATVN